MIISWLAICFVLAVTFQCCQRTEKFTRIIPSVSCDFFKAQSPTVVSQLTFQMSDVSSELGGKVETETEAAEVMFLEN